MTPSPAPADALSPESGTDPVPRRRAPDLRLRFGLILGLALLPLLVFSIWQATLDFRQERVERAELVESSARLSVDGLMSAIGDTFVQLEVLSDTVRGNDCQVDFTAVLDATSEITSLSLADPMGRTRCTVAMSGKRLRAGSAVAALSPANPAHIEVRRPEGSHYNEASLVLYLGDFSEGGNEGLDNDENGAEAQKPDRVFFASINLSRLDAMTKRRDSVFDTDVAVVSSDGDALFRSTPRFPKLNPASYADLTSGRRRLRARDSDRRERNITVLTTAVPDVYTAVSEPRMGLLSARWLNPATSAVLPLLAWLFAFGAIWIAADRLILSHLRQLRGAALHFAAGDLDTRVGTLPDAPDQIGQLGSTFDLMADRISEREAALLANVEEKSVLLREIHHRVKNNLQIIISLLNMQQRELTDPDGRQAIEEARNRVGAIALVHRSLYESDDLSDVDMKPFLDQLVRDLHRSLDGHGRSVRLRTDLGSADFESDMAIPIALFVVESVSNAIKHGVPDGGELEVEFSVSDGVRCLRVHDTGEGPGKGAESSTGWRLMRGFARQVGGKFESDTTDEGFEVRLVF